MTVDQYFEELSAGLDRLDAAAREDIVDYYREYAQEAGLSSYEQLREHFGTPRALCDSLCAELSGTAPLPESGTDPAQKIPAAVRSILGMLSGQKRDSGTDPRPGECEMALDAFTGIDLSVITPDVILPLLFVTVCPKVNGWSGRRSWTGCSTSGPPRPGPFSFPSAAERSSSRSPKGPGCSRRNSTWFQGISGCRGFSAERPSSPPFRGISPSAAAPPAS